MARTPDHPDDPRSRALRRAPASGEVVSGRRGSPRPDHDDDDDDGPTAADLERFGGVTRKCPACGRDVFDDAAVCYHCGEAFEQEAPSSRSIWIIVVVVLLIVVLGGGLVIFRII